MAQPLPTINSISLITHLFILGVNKLLRSKLRSSLSDKSFGSAQDGELDEPFVHSFASSPIKLGYSQSLNKIVKSVKSFGKKK